MIKKIATQAVVGLIVFIVVLLTIFPYDKIVKKYLDKAISDSKSPISYQALVVGLFSAKVEGISYIDLPLGDMQISYSPLSVLTHKAKINLKGRYLNGDLFYKGGASELSLKTDLGLVSKLIERSNIRNKPNIDITGDILIEGRTNKDLVGDFKISGDRYLANIMGMEFKGDAIAGDGTINKTKIDLTSLRTVGSGSDANISGSTTVNLKNIGASTLEFKGVASMYGMSSSFRVFGNYANPRTLLGQ